MDSIFLLVPIVIFFIVCAVKLFFWAVNNGQYDDLETEGRRILFDDDLPPEQPVSGDPEPGDGAEVIGKDDGQKQQ